MTRRWWVWGLVALAASLGVVVAPDPWPDGEARLEVSVVDELRWSTVVVVGSSEPIESAPVSLPTGIPDEGGFEVLIEDRALALGDVEVLLRFADGTTEVIPVLSVDDGVVRAGRTPPSRAPLVLGLLGAVVVLWVSELVPLHVAGLSVPVVLTVGRAAEAREALAPFFDPIIVLFFGGFVMAEAMKRVGLDRLAAARLVGAAGGGAITLFIGFVGVSAFLSMWMSNTAAVTVLLPIAMSVTAPVADAGYRRAVVLGVAYAATVGGVGSAIGTPANPLAITFLRDVVGREISFVGWFAFGLPAVALLLPMVGWWVWSRSDVHVQPSELEEIREAARNERLAAGSLTRHQLQVLGVFALVMAAWLTETFHEVNAGIVALAGAIALMVLGRVETEDLGRISWPTLLTFGGGLTLGTALVTSGSSDWLVTRLGGLDGLPDAVALLAVATVTLGLTTVASNTASAATLIPLAIPLAGVVGVDPVLAVVLVAVASSIDFALVIGTPPTMLAYGTGLFTARRIFTVGIALDVAGIVVVVLVVTRVWGALGLVG